MTDPAEEPTIEADDYDTAEQQAELQEEGGRTSGSVGIEVPDADAAEQASELPADDDDDYPA